jgi:hypothetical protein
MKTNMLKIYSKEGALDVSDAATTSQFLIAAPSAGVINVKECIGVLTEATGTMTVDGVIALYIAGNEVGTFTPGDDAAIGFSEAFTVDGTYATSANPYVEFAAGEAIEVKTKTQATDVTTGDGVVYLAIDFGL